MFNAHEDHRETMEGRTGEWMHTLSGKKFFPLDPRPEDVDLDSIANGLAKEERYGGQTRIEFHYSVAEHSYHMARYAYFHDGKHAVVALACLFHDAAEAYCKDLPKAVKAGAGPGYELMEAGVLRCILKKYNLYGAMLQNVGYIKQLDRRIIPLEKALLVPTPQPWEADKFTPLEGIEIRCWERAGAKQLWLTAVRDMAAAAGYVIGEGD